MSQFLFRNLNPEVISYRKASDIKYRTQVGLCITEAFKKRGYTRSEKSDQNWDIFWVDKECLDSFYASHRVLRDQKVNHYRTYFQICRKDNLNRNLKKYRRNLQREGRAKQAAQYNFAPLTFHLPLQFSSLSQQFKRIATSGKSNIWIMKPPAKLQGKGIFLFNKLNSIQQWMQNPEAQAYICQKYIENPLLIGHKKFDLRLYVLCTSYRPLTAYIYRQGFARFTHSRYDDSNISSTQIHLTNVAIQKNTSQYCKSLGGKWMLSRLKKYLLTKYDRQSVNNCFNQIKNLAIKTLRSVSKIMSNQTNCFQLYGFDIMLDDTLKPWLIEVNGSPSMRANTKKDRQLKIGVIDDMLSIIDLQKILTGNEQTLGGFDVICRKDLNFQFQYYAGLKMCMLGCRLERQKCYKVLASSLNNYYKDKKNGISSNVKSSNINLVNMSNNMSNPSENKGNLVTSQNRKQQQMQQSSSPSPNKKVFSVRKQKQNSNLFKNQVKYVKIDNNYQDEEKDKSTERFRKYDHIDSQKDTKSQIAGEQLATSSRAISLFNGASSVISNINTNVYRQVKNNNLSVSLANKGTAVKNGEVNIIFQSIDKSPSPFRKYSGSMKKSSNLSEQPYNQSNYNFGSMKKNQQIFKYQLPASNFHSLGNKSQQIRQKFIIRKNN